MRPICMVWADGLRRRRQSIPGTPHPANPAPESNSGLPQPTVLCGGYFALGRLRKPCCVLCGCSLPEDGIHPRYPTPVPRDHYVPQFYLSYFATVQQQGPAGFWVYDKDSGEPRFQTPINTTVERDLYSIPRPEGEPDRQIEAFLADLEGRTKPVLDRWQEPRARPDAEGMGVVGLFLAMAHVRVPRQIRAAQEFDEATLLEETRLLLEDEQQMKALLESHRRDTGEDLGSLEDLREWLQMVGDRFRLRVNPKVALGSSLAQVDAITPYLRSLNWCLCRASSDEPFVTSDSPVCVFAPMGGGQAVFGAGFARPRVQITFPISPSVCLLLDRQHSVGRMAVGSARTRELNWKTAWNAERFVIAAHKSSRVHALVDECKVTRTLPKVDAAEVRQTYRQAKRDLAE